MSVNDDPGIYACVYACMHMCLCVCERERLKQQLNALAAVKNQTKQALIRAREAKSSDAYALDEDYQLLCRRFAKELVSLC